MLAIYPADYSSFDELVIRKVLFDCYKMLGNDINSLGDIVQNPMKYTDTDIENWLDRVKKLRDESRKLNNATLNYIKDRKDIENKSVE